MTNKLIMLLKNKKYIKERKSNNKQGISLKEEEQKDVDIDDIYTTKHISNIMMNVSNHEYKCLPSKNAFIEEIQSAPLSNIEYLDEINKIYPNNYFDYKIMIYNINTEREIPFILYLLSYDDYENEYNSINFHSIENEMSIQKIIYTILKNLNLEVKYSGFIEKNNINYLFFQAKHMNSIEQHSWASISEIINSKKIGNIDINNNITTFFLTNQNAINVYSNNAICEIPSICYSLFDKENRQLYCGDYNNILNLVEKIEEKENYYISRGVLFVGIIRFINNIDDYRILNYNNDCIKYNTIYKLYFSEKERPNLFIEIKDWNKYFELSRIEL